MRGEAFLHWALYRMGIERPWTQTTSDEQDALRRHARGRKRALEIGVFDGVNTVSIAEALDPEGTIHAVDPFFPGRFGVCWNERIARTHIRRSGVAQRVRVIKGLSWDVADRVAGSFDFVFIDGDHTRAGIERDWSDWSPRVEPAGIIALHDTRVPDEQSNSPTLGSYRYFEEVIRIDPSFEHVDGVGSLNVLRRIPSSAGLR